MKLSNMFIIIVLVLSIIFLCNNISFSEKSIEYKKIYTSYGDTLWSIAKEQKENNVYYKDKSLQYIINDIKDINTLKNSSLSTGQELLIPELK